MMSKELDVCKKLIDYLNDIQKEEWEHFLYRSKKKIILHLKNISDIFVPHKGEIYYVQLGKNISTEINKKRPCMVWSEKKYNAWWNIVVLPIKSFRNTPIKSYNILLIPTKYNWLQKSSLLTLTDIRSVSKKRFGGKIWTIDEQYIVEIDNKLSNILWLQKTPKSCDLEADSPISGNQRGKSLEM